MNIDNWKSNRPLMFGTGLAMILVILLALVGMTAVVSLAQWAEGDAEAINAAGCMRMHSYRIAYILSAHHESLIKQPYSVAAHRLLAGEIEALVEKLKSVEIRHAARARRNEEVFREYQRALNTWQREIQPLLVMLVVPPPPEESAAQDLSAAIDLYQTRVDNFVGYIDDIVSHIQYNSERKIRWIKLGGVITILLTAGTTFLVILLIRINWAAPVTDMVTGIDNVRKGDFSYRRDNELGLLCKTYNAVAENLARHSNCLETRINERTMELHKSNRSLEYLYQTAKRLLHSGYHRKVIEKILQELAQVADLEKVMLCMTTAPGSHNYELIEFPSNNSGSVGKSRYFGDVRKTLCTQSIEQKSAAPGNFDLFLPIERQHEHFGFIYARRAGQQPLGNIPFQLVESTVDMLSVTIQLHHRNSRDKRLVLMEERAVIARELHDSLMQSLSFMKIQLAWLRKQIGLHGPMEKVSTGVLNLQVSLNSAYRQLRGLLTTFRMKSAKPTLRYALMDTVTEFGALADIPIELEFELSQTQLTPNEDIHVLQVVREALINAVKHAKASRITIRCELEGEEVVVTVADNGIGVQKETESLHQFGMAIMKERTRYLHGRVDLNSGHDGGTKLVLRFVPNSKRLSE